MPRCAYAETRKFPEKTRSTSCTLVFQILLFNTTFQSKSSEMGQKLSGQFLNVLEKVISHLTPFEVKSIFEVIVLPRSQVNSSI